MHSLPLFVCFETHGISEEAAEAFPCRMSLFDTKAITWWTIEPQIPAIRPYNVLFGFVTQNNKRKYNFPNHASKSSFHFVYSEIQLYAFPSHVIQSQVNDSTVWEYISFFTIRHFPPFLHSFLLQLSSMSMSMGHAMYETSGPAVWKRCLMLIMLQSTARKRRVWNMSKEKPILSIGVIADE